MRPLFEVIQQYVGDGTLVDYSFDFKIDDLAKIMVIQVSDLGVVSFRVRGDDAVYLTGVAFDAVEGGGTVTLAAVLPNNYRLILLLADDEPNQPSLFRNKLSFDLKTFEMAMDRFVGGLQRAAWLAQRALRINDIQDLTTEPFDSQLPYPVQAGVAIITKTDKTGITYGPTADQITNAQAYATAAQTAAAQAVAAAGNVPVPTKYTQAANTAATDLATETIDGASYVQGRYKVVIVRGTTKMETFRFFLQYLNATWRMQPVADQEGEDCGVTFTFTQAGSVAQIRAAVDNSSVTGVTIYIIKERHVA